MLESLETARTSVPRAPAAPTLSFRDYVSIRKYDYGRGTPAAWALVARLRGEPDLPDIGSWRDLRAWIEQGGADEASLAAARTLWRSFVAFRSQRRRSGL